MRRLHPIALLAVLSIVAGVAAACGSDESSAVGNDSDGAADATADGPVVDAAVPTVEESCRALCSKKIALACANDPPASECEPECQTLHTHAGCAGESAALAACVAAGDVRCSADQTSTPVASCGPETRELTSCLVAHPADAAGE